MYLHTSLLICYECTVHHVNVYPPSTLQNRGASHRIAEYKVWQRLGYHVLTIDYRGYGDTVMNGTIGETTLVEDSKAAIKLVRQAHLRLRFLAFHFEYSVFH